MNSQKIEQIISNTKASLNFENLIPSNYAVELAKMNLAGEITSEEVIKRIKKYYKI
ncbi:MAG: antitoxin VbhA family protein [Tissierellia bacterium]|nr:antitoxin VbhA family protein [Tissierellia bacterium]